MISDIEIWKDIVGYEGLYQVSNFGRVKGLERVNKFYSKKTNNFVERIIKEKILKQHYDGRYMMVTLSKYGILKTYRIHKLVAENFIPNPNNLLEINHKDEDRKNNHVNNLEWCNNEYNNNYGTRLQRLNTHYKNISFPVDCLTIDGLLVKRYKSVKEATIDMNGKTISAINHCIKGKTKTAYNYKWQYSSLKKTIFFISDLHGYFDITIKSLQDAKWDETNPNHFLIVLGDIFDRAEQNVQIFEWLYRLTKENKAIVTSGNHHKFLIDFLEDYVDDFNYIHNGLNKTINSFLGTNDDLKEWIFNDKGQSSIDEIWYDWQKHARNKINHKYPELLSWLKSLPRYIETTNYIGVHASIDTKVNDWKSPHCYRYNLVDWDALDFDDGSFFGSSIVNTNKTVVVGHFGTYHLREMYNLPYDRHPNSQYNILIRNDKRVIAIDATTILSKQVNVLKIEEEMLL